MEGKDEMRQALYFTSLCAICPWSIVLPGYTTFTQEADAWHGDVLSDLQHSNRTTAYLDLKCINKS